MHKVGKEILIVDSLQRLRPVAMILPVLAERMPFDSRLFVLLGQVFLSSCMTGRRKNSQTSLMRRDKNKLSLLVYNCQLNVILSVNTDPTHF